MSESEAHKLIKLDAGTVFVLVAIVVITAIFVAIFYMIAATTTAPPFHYTNGNITIHSYALKSITKIGWHACPDTPDVVCFGKYTVKEVVPKNITVSPGGRYVPIPGPPPPEAILPQ
jgi:hypothetical protein